MSTTAPNKPRILLVSLDPWPEFDPLYQPLLAQLNTLAVIDRAPEPESAMQALTEQPPQAVLVTDSGIAVPEYHAVYEKLLEYARSGGTVVLMGTFSSSINLDDMDKLFEKAGLPWRLTAYYGSTIVRNPAKETSLHTSLLPSYSQKAVFLKHVADEDAWYKLMIEEDDDAEPGSAPDHVPVAFTNMGKGKLGYVGDVNGEEGSDRVVLAMCGLAS